MSSAEVRGLSDEEVRSLLLEWLREFSTPGSEGPELEARKFLAEFLLTWGEQGALEQLAKNGVNRNFGLLKIAVNTGNKQLEDYAYRQLVRVALSIPWKRGWHAADKDEWWGLTDEVLVEELDRHGNLGVAETLERMLWDQFSFSYVYTAFRYRFIEEIRKWSAKKRDSRNQDPRPRLRSQTTPDQTIQRLAVIRMFETPPEALRGNAGVTQALAHAADMLREPEALEALQHMSPRAARAGIVNRTAQSLDVTSQQARGYLRRIEEHGDHFEQHRQVLRDSVRLADRAELEREMARRKRVSLEEAPGELVGVGSHTSKEY